MSAPFVASDALVHQFAAAFNVSPREALAFFGKFSRYRGDSYHKYVWDLIMQDRATYMIGEQYWQRKFPLPKTEAAKAKRWHEAEAECRADLLAFFEREGIVP